MADLLKLYTEVAKDCNITMPFATFQGINPGFQFGVWKLMASKLNINMCAIDNEVMIYLIKPSICKYIHMFKNKTRLLQMNCTFSDSLSYVISSQGAEFADIDDIDSECVYVIYIERNSENLNHNIGVAISVLKEHLSKI